LTFLSDMSHLNFCESYEFRSSQTREANENTLDVAKLISLFLYSNFFAFSIAQYFEREINTLNYNFETSVRPTSF
jgi:hypothetical protein